MDIKEFFLKQKEATYKGTVSVFSKIPRDQLGWRPANEMLTLGELVRHVWTSEEGVRRVALRNDWSYYERRIPEGLRPMLGGVRYLDEELRQLERVHQETLREVGDFPIERWTEERVHEQLKIRRHAAVMLFGINEHHIHHRAQAGAYIHILTGERASPYPV